MTSSDRVTTEQRFWSKVKKTSSCWLWTASKRNKGYGAFSYTRNGVMIQDRAHRYSWKIHNGPVPEGLCVLHNCPGGDNPACVNPAHLFLGTRAVNNADMLSKGRHVPGGQRTGVDYSYPHGTEHPNAKITPELVRKIRTLKATCSYSELSRRFGLAVGHLHRIVNRKVWKHV